MVSVSVSASVLVLNCHFRGHKVTKVPSWIKTLLFLENKNIYRCETTQINQEKNQRNKNFYSSNLNVISNSINSIDKASLKLQKETTQTNDCKRLSYFKKKPSNKSIKAIYNEKGFSTDLAPNNRNKAYLQNRTQSIDSAKNNKMNDESLEKLLKIIRHSVKLIDKNYLRLKTSQMASDEWKLVASRLDLFLFLIATLVVFITPFILFGKFMFRIDGPLDNNSSNNRCTL